MGKRKHTARKQHLYKMHGCSRKRGMRNKRYSQKHIHHRHLGGSNLHAYPNKGPAASSQTIYNSVASQYGGCGGTCPLTNPVVGGRRRRQLGGKCACGLPSFGLFGGNGNGNNIVAGIDMNGLVIKGEQHRNGCQCTDCKIMRHDSTVEDINIDDMLGGNNNSGFVGKPWTSNPSSWPSGHNGNHYKQNMLGGSASNFMSNDLVNLGRQLQYGVGSAYNALSGYSAPVNPLPWKGQLQPR